MLKAEVPFVLTLTDRERSFQKGKKDETSPETACLPKKKGCKKEGMEELLDTAAVTDLASL